MAYCDALWHRGTACLSSQWLQVNGFAAAPKHLQYRHHGAGAGGGGGGGGGAASLASERR